jgi:uncharacterized damage-inducible protein DinB
VKKIAMLLSLTLTLAASTAALAADVQPAGTTVLSPLMTFVGENRSMYGGLKKIILRAAELMPEENYTYSPIAPTRTFGGVAAHIAESQYAMCSAALGEKNAPREYAKNRTTKAELVAALNESFVQCEKAYESLNDATAMQQVKIMGGKSRLGVLDTNMVHGVEHYGNMVTYMRMKGHVPPTSDPAFMKELMAK